MNESAPPQSPEGGYGDLFVEYMAGGLQMSLTRVQANPDLLTDTDRQQAWHMLSYALKIDRLWPLVCALLLALAPKLEQAGYREEWLIFLTTAMERARAVRDRPALAKLAYHAGMIYRYLSRYDEARAVLLESEEIDAELGLFALRAQVLNQLAYVEYERSHHSEAMAFAKRTLDLPDVPDIERAMAKGILGLLATEEKRYEAAIALHREALDIRRREGDLRTAAWSLQNIGLVYRRQGIYDEAIFYLTEAAEILEQLQDSYHQAVALANLGGSYVQTENIPSALVHLRAAKDVFHRFGSTKNLALVNLNMGLAFLSQEQVSQAIVAFQLAVEQFAQADDTGNELNAIDGLALAYLANGEYQLAEEALEGALARLPRISDIPYHYDYLREVLPRHLAKAREGIVESQ